MTTNGLVRDEPGRGEDAARPSGRHRPPPRDDHGHGADDAGILRRGGKPDCEPGPFDASLDRERKNACDRQRQEDVSDRHTGVRNVRRCDRHPRRPDDRRAVVPYARRPSHHVAATPPSPTATATPRAAPRAGAPKNA